MLGDRLRKLRQEKKLTQEELGKKINVTKVSISGYENGNRTPDTETLQKLADFFNVTTDYLLGRTDDPTPPEQDDIPEELKDPKLGLFFKELAEAPEERREQLLKIWEILKSEGDRKTKDK
ncbi:transcriptional repressor of PBSX s [Geobacillus stearothermophilus]|uniref:helix-turn-helix domain-containing protein n=1 Tax=Geobacillus stearothermophilus TaxID=1422 RepID=UPI0006A1B2A8|nr:helix-turn-helix transcriptional regulator [Geobacillus stearothermophilus]KMY62993.1 XRE family transcriptional regulator [Geobacillus stearothermophilus]KMY63307.1 XRE family transcriptional regulator [Geobacillus stearothermophilus]KMY64644.1 XRE family transcriptional regulator [Geobacillus stearothermophilus]OAO77367.1 transcriptional repressor of PBSX s [Geobacillus stearothermophilus]